MLAKIRRKREIKDKTSPHSLDKDKRAIPKQVATEFVDTHFGFMKTKGRLLKALMEEKKHEREL